MCQSCARSHERWHFAAACLIAVLAALTQPLASLAQDERTVMVRGVVVDEAGLPVADSRIAAHSHTGRRIEAAAATGEFTISVPLFGNELLFTAQNKTGDLQGMQMLRPAQARESVRIPLHKAREFTVTVNDASSRPVAAARVGLDAGNTFLRQGTIAEELTDESGRAVLRFPAEATLQNLFAVKRDVGINFSPLTVGPTEAQTIVLGDNVTFQVRVTDDEDKPLAGVALQPSAIRKGQPVLFSLRDFDEVRTTTDEAGMATIRMLPRGLATRVSLDVRLDGYTSISNAGYDPRTAPQLISATLAPLVTLRGKVTCADGNPPGRTEVHAAGIGYYQRQLSLTISSGWHADGRSVGFRTTCKADGTFELPVARNHYYALLAWSDPAIGRKDCVVSPIQMKVVRNQPPAEELSLTLEKGTRVHGMATRQLNTSQTVPMTRSALHLQWRDDGSYAKLAARDHLPGPKADAWELIPTLVQDVWTDGEGQFEFFAPPGHFELASRSYGGDPKPIDVTDQAEIKVDFHGDGAPPALARAIAERPAPAAHKVVLLTGRVVLGADRKRGLPGISVRRIDLGHQTRPVPGLSSSLMTTADDGSFKTDRPEGESLLIAQTPDGLLSSIVKAPVTAKEVELPLLPTATVRGRIIDARTKKPLPGIQIDTMMRTDQTMSTTLSPYAITDARGEFVLTGLIAQWPIELQLMNPAPKSVQGDDWAAFTTRRWSNLKSITAQKSEVLELGDLAPRESVQLPLDQLISNATRNIYAQSGRMEVALGEADVHEQQVLVFAASATSEICQRFFTLWYGLDEQLTNRDFLERSRQYVLLAVDSSQPLRRRPNWQTLLQQAGLEIPAAGDAGLAILQPDGKVIAATTGGDLSADGKLAAEKLAAFLSQHAPALLDATRLLDDGLAEAKRAGKRVLIFQSVPYSAPSALLNLFLQAQKDLLAKDYVCVTLSPRHTGAAATVQSIGGEITAVPWLAVLDVDGKPLASTRAPASPDPPGAERVEKLLETTARMLTAEDIHEIVKALWIP